MNMSFSLTTDQVRRKQKTVTRRLGWSNLKMHDRVEAVVKGMGLKKGQKVERICTIKIISNRSEPLDLMLQLPKYGNEECRLEGFPNLTPMGFVKMFCEHNNVEPNQTINRIEFDYV